MAARGSNQGSQAVLMVGGVIAAALARKVVPIIWVAATGKPAVDDPSDPEVETRDAILYAVLTGVAVSIGRTLVSRRASAMKRRGDAPTAVAAT
jgi:hypothetical protein